MARYTTGVITPLNPKRDKEDEEARYRNRIIYSLPVRAGEWSNQLAMRDETESLYAYKKDHCQLLLQKTRKMFRYLLRPTTLLPEATYIHYYQNYQIRSGSPSKYLMLSALLNEREVDTAQHLEHGCSMSASPNLQPCVRNTFIFVACDGGTGAVNYGDDVFIQIVESAGLPLYLQCENSTMDTFGGHPSLRLSQSPDIYCRFKIIHWKPQLRPQTQGTHVFSDTHVIIQHTASGHNLAAEFHNWIPTFFGPECSVSCHTFRDTHRMETSENLWRIVGDELESKLVQMGRDVQ